MNTPYDRSRATFDPALFAAHEQANRAARIQYKTMPIAFRHVNTVHKAMCIHNCGRRTESRDGECRACKRSQR